MNQANFEILIPTCGRVELLEKCLQSISRTLSPNPDFSVRVLDNNIDSALSDSVKHATSRTDARFQYTRVSSPGLTAARHHELLASSASVFCYVDDDVLFTEKWYQSTRSAFSNLSVAIAGGPSLPVFTESIPLWFWDFFQPTPFGGWCCPWLSLLDIGEDVDDINPNLIWGLNFAIRREVILECGGFHIDLVPKQFMRWQGDGETGLTMKLKAKGYKAVYRQDSLLYS